jgi:hypothetical protein
MAILAGLLSLLGRFAGQLLNTTLGWATLLLFGKVPQQRQGILLVIVFGSLVWVALVLGVIVPDVGTFLVAAVPAPDFVDEGWIRLAMLAGALIVPLAIGVAAVFVTSAENRPRGIPRIIATVLRGYPFAFVLAVVMVELAVVSTVRKLRSMSKRWEDAHVPVIVKPAAYDEVLGLLQGSLTEAGVEVQPRDAGMLISGPPKLLDLVAGRALGDLVPDRLKLLVGKQLEILVYPSDLAISGTKDQVARSRAVMSSRLVEAPAYLTTTAEAQKFEDELERLGAGASARRPEEQLAHIRQLDAHLAKLAVPYDEWETLYRMRLQLERDALAELEDRSTASDEGSPDRAAASAGPSRTSSRAELAMALGGVALIAIDLALLLTSRRRRTADGEGQKRASRA